MAKRVAAQQLTQDMWDEEDEVVDAGVFEKAQPNQLKDRVMKKAKRSLTTSGSSPFAGFAGLAVRKSPFIMSNGKDKNSSFGPKPSSELPKFNSEPSKFNSGNFFGRQEAQQKAVVDATPSKQVDKEEEEPEVDHEAEYFRQMKSLNNSFLNWVKEHMSKNCYSDFSPVCKDYEKHALQLDDKFKIIKEKKLSGGNDVSRKTISTTSQLGITRGTQNIKDLVFGGGGGNKQFISSTTSTSSAPNASLFSFGSSSKNFFPTASSSPASSVPFSFATKVASAIATNNNSEKDQPSNNDQDDDNYVPPKNEFTPVEESDAIFSQRCKLFYKKDGNFMEKGVGILHLKSLDDKTQLLIRADTSLGNILLNVFLTTSIPTQRMGKNNVLIVCPVPKSPNKNDTENAPTPFLIRVKTAEEADALLKKIDQLKC